MKFLILFLLVGGGALRAEAAPQVSRILKLLLPEQVLWGQAENGLGCVVSVRHDNNIRDDRIGFATFEVTIQQAGDNHSLSYFLNDSVVVGGRGDCPILADTDMNSISVQNFGCAGATRVNRGGLQVNRQRTDLDFFVYRTDTELSSHCTVRR